MISTIRQRFRKEKGLAPENKLAKIGKSRTESRGPVDKYRTLGLARSVGSGQSLGSTRLSIYLVSQCAQVGIACLSKGNVVLMVFKSISFCLGASCSSWVPLKTELATLPLSHFGIGIQFLYLPKTCRRVSRSVSKGFLRKDPVFGQWIDLKQLVDGLGAVVVCRGARECLIVSYLWLVIVILSCTYIWSMPFCLVILSRLL